MREKNKCKIYNYSLSKIKNKAQMKIQQMAIMLVAITLFFMLVFMFYITFESASLRKRVVELNRDQAVGLVTKIAFSPELNYVDSSRGVDFDKLMVLKEMEEYEDFWNVESIVIDRLYPKGDDVECTLRNYPNCTEIILVGDGNGEFIHSYVSLCRKQNLDGNVYDRCELALLKLGVKEIEE